MICACPPTHAQDTEQQLQALKQQYEETTKEFEQRISVLELQIEVENARYQQKLKDVQAKGNHTVGHAASISQEALQKQVFPEPNEVGAKFQGQLPSEPSYDLPREADNKIAKLQEREGSFEFHGYFRSGFA
jgi:hypothetical protein